MAIPKPKYHAGTAKWFFLLLLVAVLALAWRITEPFLLALVTAGIAGIILAPVDRLISRVVKSRRVSALAIIAGFLAGVFVPLTVLVAIIVSQASDAVRWVEEGNALEQFATLQNLPLLDRLPESVQARISDVDLEKAGIEAGTFIVSRLDDVFTRSLGFIFQTFIFLVALYFFLTHRGKIYQFAIDLSPFKDGLDREILARMIGTIRTVFFGALTVAVIQGVVATIGLTIAGIPGAVLWGALAIIASQVPMLGVSLVMAPSVIYLLATGQYGLAIFLTIWAVVCVGGIDNLLTPKLLGGRTKMPEIFVLIFLIGGLRLFGPIGFIIGPTVLAGLIVLIDLYKGGFLENSSSSRLTSL